MNILFGGGLGNQMFLYAFIFAQLSEKQFIPESIDVFMNHNPNEDPRKYALSPFNLSLPLKECTETSDFKKIKQLVYLRKVLSRSRGFLNENKSLSRILMKLNYVYSQNIYEYIDYLEITPRTVLVEGAFQSPKYFEGFRESLISEFSIKEQPNEINREMLKAIHTCNSVCVHIRRGDFLNSAYASSLAICDKSYYEEAVKRMRETLSNPVFFVFSNTHDDIEWIRKNYTLGENINYVDLGNSDYEELRLMCSCKHFIISNSTYSWWAQYLSTSKNKIVIAPSIWTKMNVPYNDSLYMPEWYTIDVEGKDVE